MAWGTFFGVVIGLYAIYYVLNFLYDLFFSRKHLTPAETAVHYNIGELVGGEEDPYQVTDEPDHEQQGYGDQDFEDQGEGECDEEYDDEQEQEQGYADEIEQDPTPALRVEGQGIPLDDFLKDAKSYAKTIF